MSVILALIIIICILLMFIFLAEPTPPNRFSVRSVLRVVLFILLAVWLLQVLGVIGPFDVHFGKVVGFIH